MPHINEMRDQFDGLSINDKYEYVTQLKEFIEKSGGKPEHREFLTECIHKYNNELERTKQNMRDPFYVGAEQLSGNGTQSASPDSNDLLEQQRNFERANRKPDDGSYRPDRNNPQDALPQDNTHPQSNPPPQSNIPPQPSPRDAEQGSNQQPPSQRRPARADRQSRGTGRGRNGTGSIEKPAGGIGNAIGTIPKAILIPVVAVVVVGITVLTLWATGLLPWARTADDPDDVTQIGTDDSGDALTNEIEAPTTIVLSRVTDGAAPMSDEEMYAAAFEEVRNDYGEVLETSTEKMYAFYDIDGNGVKELIIRFYTFGTSGEKVIIYTLSDGIYRKIYDFWDEGGAGRNSFSGINEKGYIVSVASGFNEGDGFGYYDRTFFHEIVADGTSTIWTAMDVENSEENGLKYYTSTTQESDVREIIESEYNDLTTSMTVPYIELDWKSLTETTGTGISTDTVIEPNQAGNRHLFSITLEEYISGAEHPAAWYIQNMHNDGVEAMIATRGEYTWVEFIIAGRDYGSYKKEYRLFYIYNGDLKIYDFQHTVEDSFILTHSGYISIVQAHGDDFSANIYTVSSGEVKITYLSSPYQHDRGTNAYFHGETQIEIDNEQFNEYMSIYGLGQNDLDKRIILSNFDSVISSNDDIIEEGYNTGQIAEILAMTLPDTEEHTPPVLTVTINGNPNDFYVFNINGTDYLKLRDLAMSLNGTDNQFSISETADEIMLNIGQPYSPIGGELTPSDNTQATEPIEWRTVLDGNEVYLTGYLVGGNYYFTVQDLSRLLCITIG